jgi:hypothetical protein
MFMQASGAMRRENAKLHSSSLPATNAKRLRKEAKQTMAPQKGRMVASLRSQ